MQNSKGVMNSQNMAKMTAMGNAEENIEQVQIRKVGVLSMANLVGVAQALIGLFFGLVLTISSFLMSPLYEGTLGMILGMGAVVAFPIVWGVIGWISGLIAGVIYNLSAKITKGIVLHA